MKGQKINKKSNTVVAVVCLLIGLALLAGGIYLLVAGGEAVNGGIMVGLGALIIALFGCTMYLIVNFDKLQRKAEEKAAKEAEARRMARRMEADRLRAERRSELGAGAAASDKETPSDDENDG